MLFDTNIVLDVLLDREPFATTAAELFSHVERGNLPGYVYATTLTTVYYLVTKVAGANRAREEVKKLLTLFEIAPVNRAVLEAALTSHIPDFEDAIICEAARHAGAKGVVTRDPIGFKHAHFPIYSPQELWNTLHAQGQ